MSAYYHYYYPQAFSDPQNTESAISNYCPISEQTTITTTTTTNNVETSS